MKKILLAISLLVGGVATAQQDLQDQINQLRAEIDQLKATAPAPLPMPQDEEENPIHKKFNMYFNIQSSFDLEKVNSKRANCDWRFEVILPTVFSTVSVIV